jgi:hypothetical protein
LFAPARWAAPPDCKKCICRMLFKKKNLLCCRRAAAEPMGVLAAAGAPTSENASPRVGNCGQMGFRGRRNAAGASSRPRHGRNRASSWPDPAAMCNDRAPPKKAPGREPGARGAECIIAPLAGAQGGVLDADRASPAFAQRSAINRRSVRVRALGAARQKRLPCRHRECAARRGAAARRRASATIKGRRQHNPPIPSQTRYGKPSEARRPSR